MDAQEISAPFLDSHFQNQQYGGRPGDFDAWHPRIACRYDILLSLLRTTLGKRDGGDVHLRDASWSPESIRVIVMYRYMLRKGCSECDSSWGGVPHQVRGIRSRKKGCWGVGVEKGPHLKGTNRNEYKL
jgi:hypothetical protein